MSQQKKQNSYPNIFLLEHATNTSKTLFFENSIIRTYKKGESVFRDKEQVNVFYFLLSGYLSLYKISNNHEKKVIFICRPGEIINEVMIQKDYASIYAETLSKCEILAIEKKTLRSLMAQDYAIAESMMASMTSKIRRLYRQLKNTPNSIKLDHQLASKIWKLGRDFGSPTENGIEIKFDITISFLADMLGTKRETVSRQFQKLSSLGIVSFNRRKLCITDLQALEEFIHTNSIS